jgi:hypothetical protein
MSRSTCHPEPKPALLRHVRKRLGAGEGSAPLRLQDCETQDSELALYQLNPQQLVKDLLIPAAWAAISCPICVQSA